MLIQTRTYEEPEKDFREHKFYEIQQMQTVHSGIDESCFRSFHILELVKEYLALGTPTYVIQQIIDFLEG